ncbi:MAG TPA: NB-ARC domain-containing protein [Actinoplanes sp.]|nr:NB-ARC domain-containing protein [Actinoplanes sp.]
MTNVDERVARVAQVLRRHRLTAGLTQEELADQAGVAVRTVRNLELGLVARPRRHTLEQIADRLNVSAADRDRLLGAPGSAGPAAMSLPARLPDFAGRREPLRRITGTGPHTAAAESGPRGAAAGSGSRPTASGSGSRSAVSGSGPRTVVIGGPPGIGKSSLAVQAAHEMAATFPAGAFFVSLRGTDDEPTSATDALGQVLAALGTGPVPSAADDRTAAYRRITSSGRGLLVLDNVRDEAQVRPLLPTGSDWLTLITSRGTLGGLFPADRIMLDVFTEPESYRLLTRAVGADRIGTEPQAAAEIARLCGGLPLALRVAANRLIIRPEWSVQSLAEQLRDQQHRLDRLHVGDIGVRSAFELSYRLLDEPARRTLRLLSTAPLPTWTVPLVAVLTGLGEPGVELIMDALVDTGLVNPSPAAGRFALHDLVGLFAAGRSGQDDEPAFRLAAQDRLSTEILNRCHAAGLLIDPGDRAPTTGPPSDPAGSSSAGPAEVSRTDSTVGIAAAGGFASARAAIAWLDGEQPAVWWAVRHAAAQGRYRAVLTAADDLYWYSDRRHDALPWPEFFHLAVHAARALGDLREEARQENNLGWALRVTRGRAVQAQQHHVTALRLARRAGDSTVEGWALRYLGAVAAACGDTAGAMAHLARARQILTGPGDRLAGVVVARALAELMRARGDLAAARDVLTEALGVWRSGTAAPLPGHAVRGYLRAELGAVLAALNEPARARAMLAGALADFTAGDDPGQSGTVHLTLAGLAALQGDTRCATEHVDRATAFFETTGDHTGLASARRARRDLAPSRPQPAPR